MRAALFQMAETISIKAQDVITQDQAITTHANLEVIPLANQHVGTMAFYLRDFTRINPHTFYWSKVEEDPQEFIGKIYKILYDVGLTTSEMDKLPTYQLNDVAQTWYVL